MSFRGILRAWSQFFHHPIDPRPIGAFRILFGSLLVLNALMIWPDALVWYGEHGVLSVETARIMSGVPRLNLLPLLPAGDSWILGFLLFHLLAAIALTLGLFTRTSAAAVFVTLVSLHHRNMFILNSGDTFIRVTCFLLIFSHAGATYSLDRFWRRGNDERKVSPWAQRMIQIQVSMVYLFTVLAKLRGDSWRDGTAIYYATRLEEFQRFPVPWVFENLAIMKLLTWSTLAVELSMATLVWIPRLRPYVLLSVLFLHLGIEYAMNIPLFEWVMVSALILFIGNWPTFVGRIWLSHPRKRACS